MRPLLFALSLLLLAGCTVIPVNVDYRPGYDFSQIGRYYWQPPQSEPQLTSVFTSELVSDRVARAIEAEFLVQGILRSDSQDQAELLVSYRIGIEKRVELDAFMGLEGSYSLHRGGLGLGFLGTRSQEYREATLVIDLRDPKDQRLLWRGMAERRLRLFDKPEQYDVFITETVAAILKRYPPPQ
tara:strand:- start:970 stop:1521 length:552 start_codon:yes stop_codon:yes gene_type:complete